MHDVRAERSDTTQPQWFGPKIGRVGAPRDAISEDKVVGTWMVLTDNTAPNSHYDFRLKPRPPPSCASADPKPWRGLEVGCV